MYAVQHLNTIFSNLLECCHLLSLERSWRAGTCTKFCRLPNTCVIFAAAYSICRTGLSGRLVPSTFRAKPPSRLNWLRRPASRP